MDILEFLEKIVGGQHVKAQFMHEEEEVFLQIELPWTSKAKLEKRMKKLFEEIKQDGKQ